MGIKSLGPQIKQYGKEKDLNEYNNQIFGIDTSLFLYKFEYGKRYLQSFLNQIIRLRENGILPLYVFDGVISAEKVDEMESRSIQNQRFVESMEQLDKDSKKYKQFDFHKIVITDQHIIDLKKLLTYCGIPYLHASGEADHLLVKLCIDKSIDAIVSEDLDSLSSGCGILIRGINNKNNKVIEYNLYNILNGMDFTKEQFTDYCILLGCDYTTRKEGDKYFHTTLPKVGPVTASKYLHEYKSIEGILKQFPEYKKVRDFNYKRARKLLTSGFVGKTNKPKIKKMNLKKLHSFLLQKTDMSEDKINSKLEILKMIN